MKLEKVDFDKTNQFAQIFLDYLHQKPSIQPFYHREPTIESFREQIKSKQLSEKSRKILSEQLKTQYKGLEISTAVEGNVLALKESNTFTITTGHQLNIFTGPLYFVYKIVSVINTCRELKKEYPDYNFVPIYWMASEDHDFKEINHFRLNGKKITWNSDQKGAVGRFNPSGLTEICRDTPGIPDFFEHAYRNHETLAGAVRDYVNTLFGEYGLVVIDGDDAQLKSLFTEIITDDLKTHQANKLVEAQSAQLAKSGYKTQVFPREINLFYLRDNLRERIVREGDNFRVLETELTFSMDEIEQEVQKHPERFSPNVILRPLYQEVILPNLAYFGGPGEMAYWLQLKTVFEHYEVPFPILMPRNFALIIRHDIKRKMDKAGLTLPDLFKPKHMLLKELAVAHAKNDIHLNGQKESILTLFDKIKGMAESIDPTLRPHVEAQQTIIANKLDNIQKKFIRAEKKNQSDRMRQAEDVLDQLFPGGVPQERSDNFLNFFLSDASFIEQLINYFEPFDFRFNVFIDG
ncbi:MAG: bacillithiol biosynthesis cysteine-adding enzyme BshC [Fulvivirga sp.]|nr:bacillithiol biosynthesis cysteine-adding enzyme BshC [Fulvivirga sp.]